MIFSIRLLVEINVNEIILQMVTINIILFTILSRFIGA